MKRIFYDTTKFEKKLGISSTFIDPEMPFDLIDGIAGELIGRLKNTGGNSRFVIDSPYGAYTDFNGGTYEFLIGIDPDEDDCFKVAVGMTFGNDFLKLNPVNGRFDYYGLDGSPRFSVNENSKLEFSGSKGTAGQVLKSDGSTGFGPAAFGISDITGLQTALDAKVPITRKINGYGLDNDFDITLFDLPGIPTPLQTDPAGFLKYDPGLDTLSFTMPSASDIGAYPSSNPSGFQTLSDVSSALSNYVPTSRTVNGHALSNNVIVTSDDLAGQSVFTGVLQWLDHDGTTWHEIDVNNGLITNLQ